MRNEEDEAEDDEEEDEVENDEEGEEKLEGRSEDNFVRLLEFTSVSSFVSSSCILLYICTTLVIQLNLFRDLYHISPDVVGILPLFLEKIVQSPLVDG